jgi:6-bladed beta-propeller
MRAIGITLLAALPAAAVGQEVRTLPAADRALAVDVDEVFRVGGADAPAWASFDRIAQVGFDGAGRLYVLDSSLSNLVVVGRDGRHIRTTGREGGGPGEFQTPTGLEVGADGRVVVFDVLARAFHSFTADGTYVRTDRLPPEFRTPAGFALLESTVFAPARLYNMNGVLSLPDGAPATAQPLYVFALGDAAARKVGDAWVTPRPEGKLPYSPHAFATRLHWARVGDRIALVDSVGYDIELRDFTGRMVGRIQRPIAAREPSRADRERAREQARADYIRPDGRPRVGGASMSGPPGQRSDVMDRIEAGLRALTFADRVPVIDGLGADPEGRLWVARTGAVWGEPGPVDVIDVRTGYVGTVAAGAFTLPDAFGPGGLFATIELDELDAPVVVVRRIRIAPR